MSLGVGLIGAGVMGAEHARLLHDETPGAHLVAVCDADADRARAAARGAKVLSNPLALVRSDAVQAVIIAAPDAAHAGLALACIAAGKPVLCEKPLATTASEALAVVAAEVETGRRLVQVGYMRRFDPAYAEMKRLADAGGIGAPVVLHNVHRNVAAPAWFTGTMAVTNSFVHEIDISRWLLNDDFVHASVQSAPGGDPLLITMESGRGVVVSTEVFLNARYGYHVHAQLVGRNGTVEMSAPTATLTSHDGRHGHAYPDTWVPRFREAYRLQMAAWVRAATTGAATGASAWDGYAATAIAEQIAAGLGTGQRVALTLAPRPALYA